jgi:TonB family protein
VNNFNVSQLKQRIMMMNQSKSPLYKVGRYLLVLPLVLLFLMANSIYAAQRKPADAATSMLDPAVAQSRQEQLSTENRITPELIQSELEDQSLQQPPPEKKEEEIFVIVENQPEFPGGMGALMKFIGDSIRYPVEAQQKGIQGRVICSFVVRKDGSISDLQIVRGVDPLLDAEALRVLGLMPKWKPGMQRGQAVNVRFTLPVVFSLQGEKPEGQKTAVTDEVFVVVEDQPQFPGGNGALMKFISDNIVYPKEAHANGIQGRVICNFVVRKDGSISDLQVVRGVDPLLDAEALRVLGLMPQWKPGKQRGQNVNVRYTLPIVFSLNNTPPTEEERKAFQEKLKNTEPALFPGGEEAYMKFLANNVKYPVIAQENGIQGLVEAVYTVDTNGKVTSVRIEKEVDPSLDKEVKRVIEEMPDWTPAKLNGESVRMTRRIPFVFRLQGEGMDESNAVAIPENAIVVVGYAIK